MSSQLDTIYLTWETGPESSSPVAASFLEVAGGHYRSMAAVTAAEGDVEQRGFTCDRLNAPDGKTASTLGTFLREFVQPRVLQIVVRHVTSKLLRTCVVCSPTTDTRRGKPARLRAWRLRSGRHGNRKHGGYPRNISNGGTQLEVSASAGIAVVIYAALMLAVNASKAVPRIYAKRLADIALLQNELTAVQTRLDETHPHFETPQVVIMDVKPGPEVAWKE